MTKRRVSSLRDNEIAASIAAYMFKHAKKHPSAGRLWEGSINYAIAALFEGTLDDDRAGRVRSFLRLNKISSYWENGVFKGWAVPAVNPLSNWRSELPVYSGSKIDPRSLISPLPIDNVKISCAYCNQSFDGQEAFEAHKNGKVNCVISSTCKFCSKVFVKSTAMTAHIRFHGDEVNRAVLDALAKYPDGISRRELEAFLDFGFSIEGVLARLNRAGLVSFKGSRWFSEEEEIEQVESVKPKPVAAPITNTKSMAQESPVLNIIMKKIENMALEHLKKNHEVEYQELVASIVDKLTTVSSV